MTQALPARNRFFFCVRYNGPHDYIYGRTRYEANWQRLKGKWTKAQKDYACSQRACIGNGLIQPGEYVLRIDKPDSGFSIPGRGWAYSQRVICECCSRAMNHIPPPEKK